MLGPDVAVRQVLVAADGPIAVVCGSKAHTAALEACCSNGEAANTDLAAAARLMVRVSNKAYTAVLM